MDSIQSLTTSITRVVRPGAEAEFEAALHEFVQQSLYLPGQMGVHIMRPPANSNSREYSIVRKFSSRSDYEIFLVSDVYKNWSEIVGSLTEGDAKREELNGLESWFTLPGEVLKPLPKWKMATATFIGVFPSATLLALTLAPLIKGLPFILSGIIFNAAMVILLTWIVMPLVTHLLHHWLHSDRE